MKIKLAALILLGTFLMAMSAPITAAPDLSGVKEQVKAAAANAICNACNMACGTVSEKCYAQFQEGTKGEEICARVEEACYGKCPCE